MSRARDKFFPEDQEEYQEQLKLALGLPIASLMLLVLYYFIYPL